MLWEFLGESVAVDSGGDVVGVEDCVGFGLCRGEGSLRCEVWTESILDLRVPRELVRLSFKSVELLVFGVRLLCFGGIRIS